MKGSLNIMAVLLVAAFFAVPVFASCASSADEADSFMPYRDQLNINERAVYEALSSADPDTLEIEVVLPVVLTARSDSPDDAREYIEGMAEEIIRKAFLAMQLSSPLAFWGWGTSSYHHEINMTVTGDTVTVTTLSFRTGFVNYPVDPDTGEFQGFRKMIEDIETEIGRFNTESTDVRGKVMDINNYIAGMTTYDPNAKTNEESRYVHDVYGVFVDPNHYAVCDGYSKAFLVLCEKEGIDCVVVLGTALGSLEKHAWNYVKMDDGKWYAIDVTWNDESDNSYFLLGTDTFFQTHQQGVNLSTGSNPYPFDSPVISGAAYDGPQWYMQYIWVLAVALVAITLIALYKYVRGDGKRTA